MELTFFVEPCENHRTKANYVISSHKIATYPFSSVFKPQSQTSTHTPESLIFYPQSSNSNLIVLLSKICHLSFTISHQNPTQNSLTIKINHLLFTASTQNPILYFYYQNKHPLPSAIQSQSYTFTTAI